MKNWLFSFFLFLSGMVSAQNPGGKINAFDTTGRRWLVGGATIMASATSFILLNSAWYRDQPRSDFHIFNDGGEWKQVDKVGHAWSAYWLSRIATQAWHWTGTSNSSSVLLGSGTSLAYLLSIEYLDGRSSGWGWSWPDVGADILGTGLFAAQQLGWKDQKITLKFSAHRKQYPSDLESRADNLFGTSLPERLLKDYNQQSYWLSLNLAAATGSKKLPRWLNISVGYGAEGLYGGYENIAHDGDGNVIFDRRDIKRYRQWFLAPDIDLTRIRTNSRFLKTTFLVLNSIKVPAPTLEFSNNRFRFHALYF